MIKAQPVNLFSQRFSFTTLYCVEIILSLTTQGVPDTTTFTEGDGRACVCVCVGACVFVFRQVSAHPHEYAPSSYVYCPVTPHFCQTPFFFIICLFVCLPPVHLLLLFCSLADRNKGSAPLLFPATQATLLVLSGNIHSAGNWSM